MIRLLVCLIIVGSPCLLLAQDKPAPDANQKVIAVSVAILELNGDFQLKDGTSLSAAGLNELLANLREQKVLDRYQFFNLASVENQQASIQIGQQEPVVSGRTISPAGGAGSRGGFGSSTGSTSSRGRFGSSTPDSDPRSRFGSSRGTAEPRGDAGSSTPESDPRSRFGSSAPGTGPRTGFGSSRPPSDPRGFGGNVSNIYTTQQTGTRLQAVSRVRGDGKIVVQLSVESSRIKPAPVPESEESEEGRPLADFTPPSKDLIHYNTSALLESGVSTVIAAEGEDSDGKASRAYIIVSATAK